MRPGTASTDAAPGAAPEGPRPAALAEVHPDLPALFTLRRVRRGEELLREGEVWRHAYWVQRGILRMFFSDAAGRSFNKNFHLEGSLILPVTAAMRDAASLFYIAAVEPGEVLQAPAAAVVACLAEAGRWDALRLRLLDALVTRKLEREHDLLSLDGRERYERLRAQEPQLLQRVPLVHLASYLGLTDVSLSRLRRRAARRPAQPPA